MNSSNARKHGVSSASPRVPGLQVDSSAALARNAGRGASRAGNTGRPCLRDATLDFALLLVLRATRSNNGAVSGTVEQRESNRRKRKSSAIILQKCKACAYDPRMTSNLPHGDRCDDSACCDPGRLLMRGQGWARTWDLALADDARALRNFFNGWQIDPEPLEAWHVPDTGDIVKLAFTTTCTPFDENDYAIATVNFVDESDSGRIVTTVTCQIDGRS